MQGWSERSKGKRAARELPDRARSVSDEVRYVPGGVRELQGWTWEAGAIRRTCFNELEFQKYPGRRPRCPAPVEGALVTVNCETTSEP